MKPFIELVRRAFDFLNPSTTKYCETNSGLMADCNIGPLDAAKGVTAELVTESSLPAVFDALTMNEYCVPFVSPEHEAEVPLMVQLAPAGSDGIEVRV